MKREVFVSYASPDRAIAMKLVDELESRGITCWVAPRDVPGGTKYAEIILKALADAEVFLLLFSEHSNASEHVQREVERTLNLAKKIMPVRLADVAPSGAMDYYLATLHWIDVFDGNREGAFEETAHAVAKNLGKPLADKVDPDAASAADDTKPESQSGEVPSSDVDATPSRKPLLIGGAVLAVVAVIAAITLWPDEPADPGDGDGAGVGEAGDDAGGSDAGNGKGNPPPSPPPDPLAFNLAEASEAWSAGDLAATVAAWTAVIQLPNGAATRERIGEAGVSHLREVVSKTAEQSVATADIDFKTLESWRPLVEYSAQLGLDELAPQRQRFERVRRIVEAESQWQGGQHDQVGQSLAGLATEEGGATGEDSAAEKRLGKLLGEVTQAARDGDLGSSQTLAETWQPALKMAAERGDAKASAMLATLAWESGDLDTAAASLAQFDIVTRGAETLDPVVAEVLGKAIEAASKETPGVLVEAWEAAYNLAYSYELPGSLAALAKVTHQRNPGEAAPLYRQLFEQNTAGASLRQRIAAGLEMLDRYDRGNEGDFYRSQLQQACEDTLAEIDGSMAEKQLIEEVPQIRQAADAGIPSAQYILGDLLLSGKGLEQDEAKGFEYYQKAAKAGYARAKYMVGECYRDGGGVAVDPDETVRIWSSFTDEENEAAPEVLFGLAQLSKAAEDQESYFEKARALYEKKVAAGELLRYQTGLGYMLLNGKGGDPDYKRGFELLSGGVDDGSKFAEFLVGYLLVEESQRFEDIRKQVGIELDVERGTELLKQSARSGYQQSIKWCEVKDIKFDDE